MHRVLRIKRPAIADISGPGWSPIELLPSELMWSIVDLCPKLMYPMRLTSRAIDARVREYALLKAEVAENVAFVSTYEGVGMSEMEKVLRLEITFSPMKKRWFNLRYRLLPDHLMEGVKQSGIVRFTFREQCAPAEYEVARALLGERADEIQLSDCNSIGDLDIVSKVIEKMEFRKMKVRSEKLSQNAADNMLSTIIAHKVDHLELFVRTTELPEPVRLLTDLASYLRSLRLHQWRAPNTPNRSFLGFENVTWSPIFLVMFARKLEKLDIENWACRDFLSHGCASVLMQQLPHLKKKLWFRTTYEKYQESVKEVNETICQVGGGLLSIRHATRRSEWY